MEHQPLTPDTTFPYRLFRFAHKRSLDSVSSSYFAIVSKDSNAIGLVLLVDIDEQWHHARAAATSFWQIYVREFNHSESRSTLTRFEEGLKELNRAVVRTQEKVQQPISVAAALFENNQIHFSTIGTNRVLLARDGKFSDVTSGSDKSGNQFAAVTSGDLTASDSILLTNQNFYEFIASEPDELWQQSDATALSGEIQARAQNSELALNCVLIQYELDHPQQTTLYWEESEKRYPISLPQLPAITLPKLKVPKISLPHLAIKLPKLGGLLTRLQKLPVLALLKKIKPAYILTAALLVVAIIVAVSLGNRSEDTSVQAEQTLSEKFAGLQQAAFIETALAQISSGALMEQSTQEQTKIIDIAKSLDVTLVTNPNVANQLPNEISAIDGIGDALFLVDGSGQLWQLDGNGQLKQLDHQFKVINPTQILAFREDSVIVADSLGNIWHYQGKTAGPIALALPKVLSSGKKLIAKFANNLYVYGQEQNAVYRQSNFSGSISTSSPYFGLTALGNSRPVSWSINGDFLMITQDKKIVGILRNNVTLKPINYPYATTDSLIFADEKNIVVASDQLLTIYTSSGKLQKHYLFATKAKISGSYIAGNTLWVTVGKGLIKLSL